jgi:hypothetical protein
MYLIPSITSTPLESPFISRKRKADETSLSTITWERGNHMVKTIDTLNKLELDVAGIWRDSKQQRNNPDEIKELCDSIAALPLRSDSDLKEKIDNPVRIHFQTIARSQTLFELSLLENDNEPGEIIAIAAPNDDDDDHNFF